MLSLFAMVYVRYEQLIQDLDRDISIEFIISYYYEYYDTIIIIAS